MMHNTVPISSLPPLAVSAIVNQGSRLAIMVTTLCTSVLDVSTNPEGETYGEVAIEASI